MAKDENNTNINPQGSEPKAPSNNGDTKGNNANTPTNKEGGEAPKTFTQDEVNALMGKRLGEQEERLTKKFTDIIAKEREDAEKRAKMSAEELKREELQAKERELAEGKRELALGNNRLNAVTKLSELKIPVKFADYLVTPDAEETDSRLSAFAKEWTEALAEAVKSETAGKAPKDITNPDNTSTTDKVKAYF